MAHYGCIFHHDGVVARYGRLRSIDGQVLSCIATLIVSFADNAGLCKPSRIVDAGAGTGRFLVPVAQAAQTIGLPIELLAVDLSGPMLRCLRDNLNPLLGSVTLHCIQADLQQRSPISDESVHVVFTVATFHILSEWRAALENLVRLLVPGGCFIFIRENNQFMHETEGFDHDDDFPYINETLRSLMVFYHEQRKLCGEPYEPSEIRYSDMMPAIDYLKALGFREINSGVSAEKFQWLKPHTYQDILDCFRNRGMTTWGSDLSEFARSRIADSLERWVSARNLDTEREFFLPARLIPHVLQKENHSERTT
jgi:SAM-dependent methyltransferase